MKSIRFLVPVALVLLPFEFSDAEPLPPLSQDRVPIAAPVNGPLFPGYGPVEPPTGDPVRFPIGITPPKEIITIITPPVEITDPSRDRQIPACFIEDGLAKICPGSVDFCGDREYPKLEMGNCCVHRRCAAYADLWLEDDNEDLSQSFQENPAHSAPGVTARTFQAAKSQNSSAALSESGTQEPAAACPSKQEKMLCGPDITGKLMITLQELKKWSDNLPLHNIAQFCTIGIDLAFLNGTDIEFDSMPRFAVPGEINPKSCGTCADCFVVNGSQQWRFDINYVMGGFWTAMCSKRQKIIGRSMKKTLHDVAEGLVDLAIDDPLVRAKLEVQDFYETTQVWKIVAGKSEEISGYLHYWLTFGAYFYHTGGGPTSYAQKAGYIGHRKPNIEKLKSWRNGCFSCPVPVSEPTKPFTVHFGHYKGIFAPGWKPEYGW